MDEIELIRRKKLLELQRKLEEKKKEQERQAQERRQLDQILSRVLESDALSYLNSMRQSDPEVASKMERIIVALVVQRRILQKIDRIIVKAIERKVRGLEPTISFVRKGRRIDLSEKLREEE